MRGIRGDFLGFTFNNIHSSALGITRVTNNMMNVALAPTQKDLTLDIPGQDGIQYYGSNYTQNTFTINFAFEDLSEEQICKLKTLWNDKQIHDLIFDETPYKVYSARASGSPQLKFVCFSIDGVRHYRGEGNLNFICYFPFGRSRYSYIEEYISDNIVEWVSDKYEDDSLTLDGNVNLHNTFATVNYATASTENLPSTFLVNSNDKVYFPEGYFSNVPDNENMTLEHSIELNSYEESWYNNLDEWCEASGIPHQRDGYGINYYTEDKKQTTILIKNPGDHNAIIQIWVDTSKMPVPGDVDWKDKLLNLHIQWEQKTGPSSYATPIGFDIENLHRLSAQDKYILLDFYNGVIEGYNVGINNTKIQTLNLYNVYMTGSFFVIPKHSEGKITIKIDQSLYDLEQIGVSVNVIYLYN